MIVGFGIDVVELVRFEAALTRTPSLRDKLFTPAEAVLPLQSLAARFAAKEALAKALGAPGGLDWHDAEVVSLPSGDPTSSCAAPCSPAPTTWARPRPTSPSATTAASPAPWSSWSVELGLSAG